MRTFCFKEKMPKTETALSGQDYLIPQMRNLRRIPMRYQSILPLTVMKQYQCAVVGSAQGVVTVAVTDRRDPCLIKALTKLIGRPIFPVWVKPARMGLLIKRMEQREHRKKEMLRWPCHLSSFEIHMAVIVLSDHMKEKK